LHRINPAALLRKIPLEAGFFEDISRWVSTSGFSSMGKHLQAYKDYNKVKTPCICSKSIVSYTDLISKQMACKVSKRISFSSEQERFDPWLKHRTFALMISSTLYVDSSLNTPRPYKSFAKGVRITH